MNNGGRSAESAAVERVRIDKWLWAARFFKPRTLAADAVSGGKVHVDGQRVKPAHGLRLGALLRIQRGFDEYTVTVTALETRRGPAAAAATLYAETAESRQRREALAEQRRLQRAASPMPVGRPTKQDRRRIVRFLTGDDR